MDPDLVAALARLLTIGRGVRWELHQLVGYPGPRYKLIVYAEGRAQIVKGMAQETELVSAMTKALDEYEGTTR